MGKTLLLADDSVTIQKVVGISFASEDIAITTVDNGDDAIAKARELRPDMVLADVVMPGKNGYEVCEAIKADASLQHIPVLLLTGTFEAFDEERAEQAGAVGHVSKPFEAQTLVERVKEILARAPAPPVAAPAEPSPAAMDESSFDFFEDSLDDFATPPESAAAPARADASEPLSASLELDGSDSAFSFGDDDLADEALGSNLDAMLEPERPAAGVAAEHTVAMDPGAALEPPSAAATMLDASMLDARGPAQQPERPGPDPRAFEVERARPAPNAAALSSRDMAQAAVVDPEVAADLAVSSSDLVPGPERAPAAGTEVIAEPVVTPEPAAPPAPSRDLPRSESEPVRDLLSSELAGAAAPAGEPEPMADTLPEGPGGPVPAWREAARPAPPVEVAAPPPRPPVTEFAPRPRVEPEPPAPRPAEPPRAEPVPDALATASEPQPFAGPPEPGPPEPTFAAEPTPAAPEPRAFEPAFAAPEPRVPEPTPVAGPEPSAAPPEPSFAAIPTASVPEPPSPPPAAAEPARTAEPPQVAEPLPVPAADDGPLEDLSGAMLDRVVEQVAPAMRAELHETLERIAWESFGQISEQLVAQAIERIETIAWEVVPKLAEALVQEEIRRLKQGIEDA
jgi:CheY-like chemotaxis protein